MEYSATVEKLGSSIYANMESCLKYMVNRKKEK